MSKRVRSVATIVACLALGMALAGPARAAQEIVLVSDQFQIVKLAEVPSTIVVGNPAIADVTTDGTSLFLHPRGYGVTSILALDAKGEKLGDYLVRVIYEDRDSVAVYSPKGRQTYTCRKDCEPTFRIGDEASHAGQYSGQVSAKAGLANSAGVGGDAVTPPPPTSVESKTGIAPP